MTRFVSHKWDSAELGHKEPRKASASVEVATYGLTNSAESLIRHLALILVGCLTTCKLFVDGECNGFGAIW